MYCKCFKSLFCQFKLTSPHLSPCWFHVIVWISLPRSARPIAALNMYTIVIECHLLYKFTNKAMSKVKSMRCYVWPLLCLSSHLPNTQGFAGNHCYGRKVKEKTAHARMIHWIMVDSLVPEGYCGLGCWKEAKCSEPSIVDLVCIVKPFWLVGSKSWQVGLS